MTELKDMKREDIFNTDLIGEGIPDLGEEIAKLQSGESGLDTEADFGFGDSNFGFGDNDRRDLTEADEEEQEEED